jgi:hypothetical protein
MTKSQRHGNREAKKPKAVKLATAPVTASLLTKGTKVNMGAPSKDRG